MEHGHVMLIAAYSLAIKTLYIEQWGTENYTSKFNNELILNIYIPETCITNYPNCERESARLLWFHY